MNTILVFIVVISILVFVHELGHFLAAKAAKMKVEEFAIGFKPAIFNKKIGETRYILGIIPIGGYVKIFGENPGVEEEEALKIENKEEREKKLKEIKESQKSSFSSKNRFWQAIVLSMGVIFNFIFAYLIFLFMVFSEAKVSIYDIPKEDQQYLAEKRLIISDIQENSLAEKNNISKKSEIIAIKVDDKKINILAKDFIEKIGDAEKNIKITYLPDKILTKQERISFRNGTEMLEIKKKVLPVSYNEKGEKEKFGIYFSQRGNLKLPFFKNFEYAWRSFSTFFQMVLDGFKDLFFGKVSVDDMSGPVGIAKISGEAASHGFHSILMLLAILSINLGIVNILPFPALDGGRLFAVLIEAISRKKIPNNIMNIINGLGFLILMIFIIFITYKDILKIFFK